jgi:putative CocE/NonD family hydrolase
MTMHAEVRYLLNTKIPMRDGVELAADLYLPRGAGPFPTVLMRTAFSRDEFVGRGRALASMGYACVAQNFRGRFGSDGVSTPFHGEGEDSFDTLAWIARQPWSNGKIGMGGGSYMGMVQWYCAPLGSPHLTCMVPRIAACDHVADALAPGGAFQLTWSMMVAQYGIITGRTLETPVYHSWTEGFRMLPLIEWDERMGYNLPYWKDWIQRPLDDPYWTSLNVDGQWEKITAPAFIMNGWYDVHAASAFVHFNGMRLHGGSPAARQSKLVMGPWLHGSTVGTQTGDVDFGLHSAVDPGGIELRWFDYWLKGIDNGVLDEAPLRLFIMGVNQWRDEYEWPLARTDWQQWRLHSGGHANTVRGDGVLSPAAAGEEPADHFVYDPEFPVQTGGGGSFDNARYYPGGPHDQRPIEMRADVLCYTSAPLTADLEVTGPIKLVLYAATDGQDTDWTAKLVDVAPSGYAMNLCDGILRARYRAGFSLPTLLTPNEVYEYVVDLGVTGNVFRQGHCIRLEVSSSNFPRFDRNPNTGHPIGMDAELRAAQQTVYHSPQYPSHLLLPVIPGGR